MKKTSILIAMFAVMTTTATAKAGDLNVDFDGRTSGPKNFSEAVTAISVPGTDEDPIPWIDPGFPGGHGSPFPMTCMPYCQYGMKDDCSCIDPWLPYPWDEQGTCQPRPYNNTWYELARCTPPVEWDHLIAGAPVESKSAASARILQPGFQQKLRDILLGYCNTYPEFAAVVMPMLKDEGARITTHGGFVYIISGNNVIRFKGKTDEESENKSSSRKKPTTGIQYVDAFVQAGAAIYNAVQALNEYGSYPPVPDSGAANNYHGPALTVDPNDSDLHSYPSRKRKK